MIENVQIRTPAGAPRYLHHLLFRVSQCAQRRDPLETRGAVQDALGFLLRFFAGVASASLGAANRDMLRGWLQGRSTDDFQRQIITASKAPADSKDCVLAAFRRVFVPEQPGRTYLHTDWLRGEVVQDITLADWVLRREQEPEPDEVEAFLEVLESWLAASVEFFSACEHHYRGAISDRVELVTVFAETWMQAGFPMRTRDLRSLPMQPGQDATFRERPVMTVDTSELGELVKDLLARRERPVEDVSYLDSPPAPRTQMAVTIEEKGLSTGPFGVPNYVGVLSLANIGEGELCGRVLCGFDGFSIEKSEFQGNLCRLSYRLDPGYCEEELKNIELLIRTPDEERRICLSELGPDRIFDRLAGVKGWVALSGPALLSLGYILWSYASTCARVAAWVGEEMAASTAAVGSLQLKALPAVSQLVAGVLMLAWLAPLATAKVLRRLEPGTRRLWRPMFPLLMMMPSLGLLTALQQGMLRSPLAQHGGLSWLDFANLAPWFLLLNLSSSLYQFLSTERWLDRLEPVVRVILPICLSLASLGLIALLIF